MRSSTHCERFWPELSSDRYHRDLGYALYLFTPRAVKLLVEG
jgi:hypothetical protein